MPGSIGVLARIDIPVILATGEAAQFGWTVDITHGSGPAYGDGVLSSLNGSTAFKALFPNEQHWGPCKVSYLDGGDLSVTEVDYGTVVLTPTGASDPLPPEIAMCVSLRTALAGPAHRGRMYLPSPTTATMDATGRFTTAACSTVASVLATAMAVADFGVNAIVVLSRTHNSAQDIVRLEVGNVPDVQRRRRNRTPEVRVSEPLQG